MRTRILRWRHELGPYGIAALALIAAMAAFHLLVLQPLQARDAQLKDQAARQRRAAEPGPGSAAEKVAAVYDYLRKDQETTDWLAKLHGIGLATGVQLQSANYRTQKTEGRIVRYEIVLPVAGTYPQIRDFLGRSLAEIPVMSVDQLTLKRETRNDGAVLAELRLTLHMVKS
jgi:Tfp pilus assembly protein PilO